MPDILTLNHVTKRFSGLTAVNDLSISVEQGSIHSLVGPNGSGKSTTINMINCMLPLSEGEILFRGKIISGMRTHEVSRLGLGRTFQNIKVFRTLTVRENIMVGGHQLDSSSGSFLKYLLNVRGARAEEKMLREKAESIGEFLGMQDLLDCPVSSLAYGRQKMTELGRTLMTSPQLLLLDEPAAGLNPSERAELVEMLSKIKASGITMFLVEHNMDIVMNISDRITVINFGSKIAEGSAAEIQNDSNVIAAYLGNKYAAQQSQGG